MEGEEHDKAGMELEILYDKIGQLQVEKWGKSISQQFDSNKDGKLSKAELTAALKSLPKKKPKTMPPGNEFGSAYDPKMFSQVLRCVVLLDTQVLSS